MKESTLSVIDATINLTLGFLLMLFPLDVMIFLGIPIPESAFYANILGAILLGIGLALLVERILERFNVSGLGLEGAICINICGVGVLTICLAFGDLSIPLRRYLFLWLITITVLGLSGIELFTKIRDIRSQLNN